MLASLTVHAYEPDGYQQTTIEIRVGDRVQYHPSGRRGSAVGMITRLAPGAHGMCVQPESGGRVLSMSPGCLTRAWRNGVLLGVPAPFVGEVLRYDPAGEARRSQGEVEVARPGCARPLFLNSCAPGWPARPLSVGEQVRCEMKETPGYPAPTWFVA